MAIASEITTVDEGYRQMGKATADILDLLYQHWSALKPVLIALLLVCEGLVFLAGVLLGSLLRAQGVL